MSDEPDRDESTDVSATEVSRVALLRVRATATQIALDERYGETWAVGFARDVHRLDRAIAGGELAGALAYRLFLWFLPFVLLLVAGLGVYSDLQDESPEHVADRLGLAGLVVTSVTEAAQSNARWYALVIGVPVLLYATRTLLRTVVAVHRLAWGLEPRRGQLTAANVGLFLGVLVAFIAVGTMVSALSSWSSWSWLVIMPVAVLARSALWLAASSRLPRRGRSWIDLAPGALVIGIGFLATNAFTQLVTGEIAANREDAYGAFGVAAAVLFGLWLTSRVVVLSAVTSAVQWSRSQPSDAARPEGSSTPS